MRFLGRRSEYKTFFSVAYYFVCYNTNSTVQRLSIYGHMPAPAYHGPALARLLRPLVAHKTIAWRRKFMSARRMMRQTNNSSRAVEGDSSPAPFQSAVGSSPGPDRVPCGLFAQPGSVVLSPAQCPVRPLHQPASHHYPAAHRRQGSEGLDVLVVNEGFTFARMNFSYQASYVRISSKK